jgi:hypothetical protein
MGRINTKKAIYTEQLPPTVCTVEMKEKTVNFATDKGLSVSEVIRQALDIFLSGNYSKTIKDDSEAIR